MAEPGGRAPSAGGGDRHRGGGSAGLVLGAVVFGLAAMVGQGRRALGGRSRQSPQSAHYLVAGLRHLRSGGQLVPRSTAADLLRGGCGGLYGARSPRLAGTVSVARGHAGLAAHPRLLLSRQLLLPRGLSVA